MDTPNGDPAGQETGWPRWPAQIRAVRHLWVDHGAVIRGKATRQPGRVRMSQAQMAIPMYADVVVVEAGLLPVGDVELVPDWGSVRVLPFHPGHAAVVCDIYDSGEPWVHCPRGFLRRMDRAASQAGFDVRCGVELEFTLLWDVAANAAAESPCAVDDTRFCMDAAYDAAGPVIDQIITAVEEQGLTVAQFHPESGPGQWEISLTPQTLLAAADSIVALRQTIRSVASAHGMRPAFVPLLSLEGAGQGMHLHLSLQGDAPGVGPAGPAFFAGILAHLQALLAVTAPSPISLLRFRPHYWAGAFAGWGVGNKEAPLRVVPDDEGSWRDVEFKAADATANPYLALGCLVAAGLDGVSRAAQLPPALAGDPGLLGEEERVAAGAWPLAGDPGEVLDAFARSAVMRSAMGTRFHDGFVAVRRADLAATADWGFEQIRDLWLASL